MKFFSKLNIRKIFNNKKIAISFSIIVAFVFWLSISINETPEREQTFSNLKINVSREGTVLETLGIDVVDDISLKTASVTVHGPNYIVSSLKNEDIIVHADISDITTPGEYTVNLVASRNSTSSGYSFINVNPSSITLEFDYIDTKEFTVVPVVNGVSAVDGLIAESAIVNNSDDATLVIKGPRTEVDKIHSVMAIAEANKTLSSTTSFDAELKLFDENGVEIDKKPFNISRDSIKISVPISKKNTFSIKPTFNNVSNQNLVSNISYSLSLSSASVIGPPETIESMKHIELSPIDITKVTVGNNVFEVKPILPDGVKLLDGIETVKITFNVSGYKEKTINISNFEIKNKPQGIKDVSTPGLVKNVKICGPAGVIDSISAEDFVAYIDLSGKSAGEHTITFSISSVKYPGVWQVGSYSVNVVLK